MKLSSLLLSVFLVACGGGGDYVEPQRYTPKVRQMVVVPDTQVQYTNYNEKVYVLPYKNLSNLEAQRPAAEGAKWVYMYDELFWEDKHTQEEVASVARQIQEAGFKTMITILPEKVLTNKLSDPGAYDVVGVDIYPSLGIDWNTQGCSYNDNLYSTMLYCSVKKLRDDGFTGEIWYVYQDFPGMTPEQEQAQQETINLASKLGITGLVAYRF